MVAFIRTSFILIQYLLRLYERVALISHFVFGRLTETPVNTYITFQKSPRSVNKT